MDKSKREKSLALLKEYVPLFKKEGFTVGTWFWTFMVLDKNDYVHMESPNGAVSKREICPSDKEFCKYMCKHLQNVARCGVEMILFDDDYRYGFIYVDIRFTISIVI